MGTEKTSGYKFCEQKKDGQTFSSEILTAHNSGNKNKYDTDNRNI